MRNFQCIAQGVDVLPLVNALQCQSALWNQNDLRTRYEQSPHFMADDIWLRFNAIPDDLTKIVDDKECINYPGLYALPQCRTIIFDLMRRVEGEQLGRCMITRLAPGATITPHKDEGAPAEYFDRYHVILQNYPGSVFHCGNEQVTMKAGDVFWFNNQETHSVVNNSVDDRITMICDIRSCR